MGTSCSSFRKEHKKSIDSGTSIEEKQSTNRLADNASNISKSVNVSNETTHLIAQTQNDKQENQPKKIASQPASELRPPSQSTNINYENHLCAPSVTPSPLPSSHTPSPYTTPSANKQLLLTPSGLPNLEIFSSDIRNLLIGQKLPSTSPLIHLPYNREINIYLIENDVKHQELLEKLSKVLENSLISQKFSINFLTFTPDVLYLYDEYHRFSEICIDSLNHVFDHGVLIPLIKLNEKDDRKLLPRTIRTTVFDQIISSCDDEIKKFLQKWYYQDSTYKPAVYVLHKLSKHYVSFKSHSYESKQEVFKNWYQESRQAVDYLSQREDSKDLTKSIFNIQLDFILNNLSALEKRILYIRKRSTATFCSTIEDVIAQIEEKVVSGHKLVHTNPDSPDHESWDDELLNFASDNLKKIIESLVEEEFSIQSFKQLSGIDSKLCMELIVQDLYRQSQEKKFIVRENLISALESYTNSQSRKPLIVHGDNGSGKSSLLAKYSTCAISSTLNSVVVYRFAGKSDQSMTLNQLFRSVCEQLCILYGEHISIASSVAIDFEGTIRMLLQKANEERSTILLIDGVDLFSECEWNNLFTWLNQDTPNFVKIIISITSDNRLEQCKQFGKGFEFIDCNMISDEDKRQIFDSILLSNCRQITDPKCSSLLSSLEAQRTILFIHLIASYIASTSRSLDVQVLTNYKSIDNLILDHLNEIGGNVEPPLLAALFTLFSSMKYGLTLNELSNILMRLQPLQDMIYPCSATFPFSLWSLICHELGYLTSNVYAGGYNMIRLSNSRIGDIASKFCQKWKDIVKLTQQELLLSFAITKSDSVSLGCDAFNNEWPNRRKAQEYPHLLIKSNKNIKDLLKQYCFNKEWICLKTYFTDPYSFLEDVDLVRNEISQLKEQGGDCAEFDSLLSDVNLLNSTIKSSAYPLRYYGLQIFSQIYSRLESHLKEKNNELSKRYPEMVKLVITCKSPIISSLLPLNTQFMAITKKVFQADKRLSGDAIIKATTEELFQYDLIYPIKGDDAHVIALSTSRGEISVWNIVKEKPVRSLQGINQPKDLRMIDKYRGVVLCNRDLKIYNLDQGCLENKLKGVMNQKMPFFGLHNDNYLVALSRNRMYVNMQSLKTGDLETTFKVGEDRFLNSLLVSANGNICVCGDETQKPFPLLVWDLINRKLIYDLRIPQHEFITRLSAISDDGHYVACVSKELNSSSPNFIIVYDLQSGTLFKKWKPDCDTVSITISSQGACVINGLESAFISVWDLSTGAKRLTLQGHSSPVDTLQVDEKGSTLLSHDSSGKDLSIRLWDLENGYCLAAFTPDLPLSCCRLSPNGKMVVICLVDSSKLHTLVLRSNKENEDIVDKLSSITFGDASKEGLQLDLSKDC